MELSRLHNSQTPVELLSPYSYPLPISPKSPCQQCRHSNNHLSSLRCGLPHSATCSHFDCNVYYPRQLSCCPGVPWSSISSAVTMAACRCRARLTVVPRCSCCQPTRSVMPPAVVTTHLPLESHHAVPHIHVATHSLAYSAPPHYSTAYHPLPPGISHSSDPMTSYRDVEYQRSMYPGYVDEDRDVDDVGGSLGHGLRHHPSACNTQLSSRSPSLALQTSQNLTSRHVRRLPTRDAVLPYAPAYRRHPLLFNPYHQRVTPTSLPPPLPTDYYIFLSNNSRLQFDVIEQLETESVAQGWHDLEGRSAEPRGLTKVELERLPSYVLSKDDADCSRSQRCVICICDFEVEEKIRALPCSHEFHSACVDKWLKSNPTCPICRAPAIVGECD